MRTFFDHWPEYVAEASCLGLFMVSAASFATLLQHPASPFAFAHASSWTTRIPMGVAMGLTLVSIVYSPLGGRSGAHMNPAVTLTFLRLGKIARADVVGYIAAQFVGGASGIVSATYVLRRLPADPSVNFIATVPGSAGLFAAFAAEVVISFGMMLAVLTVSNRPRVARLTGICGGFLVATYITFEAPLSGMSMNAARTLGPALLAHTERSLWIYFTAPLLGMLLAAETYVRARGSAGVICAKLHHPMHVRCIFKCGYSHERVTV
jgi:aquaporin Z